VIPLIWLVLNVRVPKAADNQLIATDLHTQPGNADRDQCDQDPHEIPDDPERDAVGVVHPYHDGENDGYCH
jgi:hypothetical protein